MSCMSQNFRLFHVSNLSVRNFRIFLLMYPGSLMVDTEGLLRRPQSVADETASWARQDDGKLTEHDMAQSPSRSRGRVVGSTMS